MPGAITISELPPPPVGRSGWPWIKPPSADLPATLPQGRPWPRITIVTPSYNQGQFLEATIRSVLLQGYPNLEYLVLDGGSTDESVAMIRRYEPWLDYWVSAPDGGQTRAINQGFRRATGQVLAWLNSDDYYLPGTLATVAQALNAEPYAPVVYGSANYVDAAGTHIGRYDGQPLRPGLERMKYWRSWPIPQPGLFFKKELVDEYGDLDESYHYALDYEWLIRVSQHVPFKCLPEVLATYRLHSNSKTGGLDDWNAKKVVFHRECERANRKHAPLSSPRNWPLWWARLKHDGREFLLRNYPAVLGVRSLR